MGCGCKKKKRIPSVKQEPTKVVLKEISNTKKDNEVNRMVDKLENILTTK